MANSGVPRKTMRIESGCWLIPLAGFLKFLNFAPDDVSLESAQVVNKQNAVQMIDLVLKRSCEQLLARKLNRLALFVLSAHDDLICACDRFAKSRNAEEALFARLRSLAGTD